MSRIDQEDAAFQVCESLKVLEVVYETLQETLFDTIKMHGDVRFGRLREYADAADFALRMALEKAKAARDLSESDGSDSPDAA